MDGAPVFGVLCGISGGYYYGSILTGAVRAAGAVGGRVIAVKTSDAGLPIVDMSAPQNLVWPVAFDHVAGFAAILNAVRPEYLESIRATGKPVVMISDEAPGFACPVVMADGRTGVRAAVDHLLGHGHRRIAFVGCLPVADVRQRYRAYCEALSANGIRPDPRLLFEVGHNVEHAGEEAARRMLAAGMPSTAVVAGSDLNAIGLMNGLRAAGLRLPEDQAVVGFDDMAGVGCLSPALTSVRQPFDVLGERAVELILQHLAGQPVPVGHHYVETSLAVRNSCGCRPGRQSPDAVDGQPNDGGDGPPAVRLRTSQLVQRMADGFGLRGRPDPVADAVRTRAAEAVAALVHMKAEDPVPAAMLPGVERALDQVCRLDPRPETASEVAASVRAYADACLARPDDTPVPADVEAGVARVLMALVNVQARAGLEDSTRFQA